MFSKILTGSVPVNGNLRKFRVQGNPAGRTVIQVDGVTVYNKWPLVQKRVIDFKVVPGKPAKIRWYQSPSRQIEWDVTVDGQTTKLAPVPDTLEQAKAKKALQVRGSGVFLLVVAAGFFWMNQHTLAVSGEYYPKSLALIPVFVVCGISNLLYPLLDLTSKNRISQWVGGALGIASLAFGFTFFTRWFLETFGK